MKNRKIIGLFILILGLASCEEDDNLTFIAQEASEDIMFTSTFLNEYVLTGDTKDNIAERFVWNTPDFNLATPSSYELQASIAENFAEETILGSTAENNYGVTVDQMLTLAELAGLDNDPETEENLNTGDLYFRVRAFVGDGGTNAPESFSAVTALKIVLLEDTGSGSSGIELSIWGIIGSAANDWGATPDLPFYTTKDDNIIVAYVKLVDGEIKFRENNAWDTSFGDANSDGILDKDDDNNIKVTAGTYKITIDWSDNSYSIKEFYWGLIGSATPNGWDGPDTKFVPDYTNPGVWTMDITLVDGEIKIRMNDSWDTSFGDANLDGVLDKDADNNITVTAGTYKITLDFSDESSPTYEMEKE